MAHIDGGLIIVDVVIGFLALCTVVAITESVRDSFGRRKDNRYDMIKKLEKLPGAAYKDYSLLDKAIMVFLPTHLLYDYQPDDDDLKLLSMSPLRFGRESWGITYKLYKGHKVLIKRVKLHDSSPF